MYEFVASSTAQYFIGLVTGVTYSFLAYHAFRLIRGRKTKRAQCER